MKRTAEPRKARPAFRQGTARKGKLYQYGQRTRIDYGNGTFTEYNYDPARRWLDTIKTENKWGQSYQNISYSFDAVGNVLPKVNLDFFRKAYKVV